MRRRAVQSYAPGMLLSVYGTALGDFVQSAGAIPLPQYLAGFEASVNGVPTPLYYVSPNQVNIQIPYETPPGNGHAGGGQSLREFEQLHICRLCRPRRESS